MESTTAPLAAVVPLLYYTYPAAVFAYFLGSSLASACTLQRFKDDPAEAETKRPGRRLVLGILSTFVLTYLVQLGILISCSVADGLWPPADHLVVGILSCLLVFGIQLSWLSEPNRSIGYPLYGSWLLALAFEAAITTFAAIKVDSPRHLRYEIAETSFAAARCALLLVIGAACWRALGARKTPAASDEERQSLLPKVGDNATSGGGEAGYGATSESEQSSGNTAEYSWERREREAREVMEKRLKEGGNWFEYSKGFMILFPLVWPVGNYALQLRAAAVIVCLLGSNALHLLIPRQIGIIMDSLGGSSSANPWLAVCFYAVLRLTSSDAGIGLLRQWLWIPVKYYAHDSISRAAYSHMMHLSADFHDSKSSSDMMMAIYGGSAVSSVVENVLLQAMPMLIDMCVAIVYLSITYGPYEGFITVATGTIFFMMAGRLVADSKAASRKRVNALYQEHYVRQSGLQGWQTVSAFNQIGYEDNRHANAVTNRWLSEQQYILSWSVSIAFQTVILTSGLLVSAFLAVSRIKSGQATPGQFAMLLMYWAQLTSPLQFFARLGKSMSDDFIDAERLLDIMKTKPTVENKKGARPLKFVAGNVEFKDVCFTYDGHKGTIKGFNLHIDAGQTVAFVGATGAGKSTMLKLLDRFYDVTGGSIYIDGQDIREVDLFSLRERIGVVPQSPILFDDTIMNNVRYGKITASDEEVFEACKGACIHDKITGFTNGYDTRVGERGVKLSGGELQRVAIARAILKKPDIVLLDEATSAVDTDTEQQIQLSFRSLCKGRTTFIVAHRLSTIMNADRIVVVEGGQLIEQGSHHELIAKQGRYADLWSKQAFLKPCDTTDMVDIIDDRAEAADDSSSEQTAADPYKSGTTDSDSEGSKLNPIAPEFTPRAMANSCSEFEGKSTCERAAVASVEEASGKASEPASGHSALSEVPGDGTRSEVEMKLATPSDKAERGSSENAPVSKDKAADVHKDLAQDASTLALGVGQAEDTTGENQNGPPSDA
ncbi:heavy metal tolerance protein [Ophiocordyceps sinensis CO18]|uniref:Heavy metal tolerance protein n=1 Tax=Ophiocordyceps sinensis (strain Co18 / CGMCC 3.14243) TaxID=911162 RepID=T5AKT8_OPHSC|nr:heavy metal tolerance protein [Ophiocordyceps sinensis CO18]